MWNVFFGIHFSGLRRLELLRGPVSLQRLGHRLLAADLVPRREQRHGDGCGLGDHLQQGEDGCLGLGWDWVGLVSYFGWLVFLLEAG